MSAFGAVSWTGSGGSSWASGSNWSNGSGPGTSDTVLFTDTGASTLPGDLTSLLNISRTIGGVGFTNSSTKFQTLDLNGQTLTLTGNLSFNVNTGTNSTATIRNGALVLNSAFANIYAGWAAAQSASGAGDLSGLTSLSATIGDLQVGTSTVGTVNSSGTGVLTLTPLNTINATRVLVGSSTNSGESRGTLHLGMTNTINAGELTIARDNSYGTVDIVNGGSLTLGSVSQRTLLQIAAQNFNTTNFYTGKLDLGAASTFNAYLSSVIVGQKEGTASGNGTGTLIGAANGTMDVGAAGNTANFYVGRMLAGGNSATGYVDLSSMTALNASLSTLSVGTAASGSAQGTLYLAKTNTLSADSIIVGSNTGNATSTMRLGQNNTILTNQFVVGQGLANATVSIVGGGALTLGSSSQRAGLLIATGVVGNNTAYTSKMDLTGATFNAYLADLVVGQKDGAGTWPLTGSLIGAAGGSVNIGAPGNTANIYVGRNLNSTGGANGSVEFSALSTFTANVNTLSVGTSLGGPVSGTMSLATSNTINANTILVGSGGGGTGSLALGQTNTILANQFTVGKDNVAGTVTIRSGGSLTLGSPSQRTVLQIGVGVIPLNTAYTSSMDLTGASFNAYLSDLVVGQKDGAGTWPVTGSLIGAGGGSVDIGAAGNTASVFIGRNLGGSGSGGASVDFSGLATLNANLATLAVGTATSGIAQGTFILPTTNTINANSILVGSNGKSGNTLALGRNNTILTDQLLIGQDAGSGAVTVQSGGSLTLGSSGRRTNISLSGGQNNDGADYYGTLNLGNAAFIAYLGDVLVGGRSTGSSNATLTIGSRPENWIDVNNLTFAGSHSTGTVNYGGGVMYAGTIAAGPGYAAFNWTGGQISVGTWATSAIPFNLNNTGTGTLAPGSASVPIGTTTINGAYTQGAGGTMAIEITGASPGTGNDVVYISGAATLAGSLKLSIPTAFAPTVGQNFLIATYASRTGTFAFVAPPHLPADVAFQLDYTGSPTQLIIHAVAPTAQNWVSAASSGTFGTAGNWDTAAAPGMTSSVSIANSSAAAKTVSVTASTTVHRISLQGTVGAVTLDVPSGVQLGVANQLVVGTNATLTGGGRVVGDVVVAGGTVTPGAALNSLVVGGDLSAQASATVQINLTGSAASGAYGHMAVNGTAALAGTLDIGTVAVAPAAMDSYQIMTFATRGGEFSRYSDLDIPGPLVLAPVYSATDLRLVATLPGDATTDGWVGFADLVALAQNYDTLDGSATWTRGDFNLDGNVNFTDLVMLAQNYDGSAAGALPGASVDFQADMAAAFASVPEPSGLTVLAAGAMAALTRRKRRSN